MNISDELLVMVIGMTILCLLYGRFNGKNISSKEIMEKELTPDERESIASIISNFEKDAKRKTTDKELAFIVFAVKSWRLHENPSYMSTLYFEEGQNSFDDKDLVLGFYIQEQWKKKNPEDYIKFKQRLEIKD